MSTDKKVRLVLAITGASGAIYALNFINKIKQLQEQFSDISIVFSDYAKQVWAHELPQEPFNNIQFPIYSNTDFFVPFASGSSNYNVMVICPCSMGTLGRIASGVSNDLITRSADVMLKERKKLILVTRETPLSLIHINNMKLLTEAGAVILPASPSFYSQPETINDVVNTVVDRIIQQIGLQSNTFRWKEE